MFKSLFEFKKIGILAIIGYVLYLTLEVTYGAIAGSHKPFWALKGSSSLWMGLNGSILLVLLGYINEIKFLRRLPMFFQSLIGCGLITLVELISGLILNVWLGFDIWSYDNMAFNFMGQICLLFSFYWFILSPFVMYVDDTCRWIFYKIDNSQGTRLEFNCIDYYKALFDFKHSLDVIR